MELDENGIEIRSLFIVEKNKDSYVFVEGVKPYIIKIFTKIFVYP